MAEAEKAVPPLVLYVVDDDPGARTELGRILGRRTGFRVLTYERPSQALAALAADPPDLALVDLRLPEMDGLELVRRLQTGRPDLAVVVMTAYGEEGTAARARESGALDFVEKPLDLAYLLVVLRQMEREVRLRKTLRDSAGLFSRVLDMMPDGLVMTDAGGTPLFANALGERLLPVSEGEDGERCSLGGRVYRLEVRQSGERRLMHWADLTSALERERISAYKQMSRHLAHEIRNPLTPMRLWIQELQSLDPEAGGFPEAARRALGVLLDQIDRLQTVVDRFSQLAGDSTPILAPLAVMPVARQVVLALGPYAQQLGVNVVVEEGGDSLSGLGEEGALYQCIFNALRNALEASSGRAGSVHLGARVSDVNVLLEIADSAGGLPAEVAEAPFTPYLTTKTGGTGLGLLVCRDLAERMGGRFELENRPGSGVTARIVLALAAGGAGAAG